MVPSQLQGELSRAVIDISASGNNSIVVGVAGKVTRIYRLIIYTPTATTVTLQDGASTKLMGALALNAGSGWEHDFNDQTPFVLTVGNDFVLNLSAANQVSGTVWYSQT